MNYQELHSGDILQKNDEYSAMYNVWRVIPEFMIGDVIPDCDSTHWRRPPEGEIEKQSPKWFQKKTK